MSDTITPADIANILVNLPAHLRGFVMTLPADLFAVVCLGLKTRQLDKRTVVGALQADHDARVEAERREREAFTVPGFEAGDLVTAVCEHWEGLQVEVVGFIRDERRGLPVLVRHKGSTYNFAPSWLTPIHRAIH